jgi:TetR/AcrR family transcriptional regulator, transcriptional repressor for nem operon
MARPRQFLEEEVVELAARHFAKIGYNATSIDDLVAVTGLQRGSLYKAFGSKLNLFTLCFDKYIVEMNWSASEMGIDLMIVALREVVDQDRIIEKKCKKTLANIAKSKAASLLGSRLVQKVERK